MRGAERSREAQLGPELQATIDGAKAADPAVRDLLQEWARDVWLTSNSPDLRYLLLEMLGFIRARNAFGQALAGQEFTGIDLKTAQEGLWLAAQVDKLWDISFDSLPKEPESLTAKPDNPSAALLRASFPLIRQVEVKILVSKEVWDLSDLRDANEFVLPDFLGIGADKSRYRDTFLCLRELEQV